MGGQTQWGYATANTISGGHDNRIAYAPGVSIGGGLNNFIDTQPRSFIGGGQNNRIGDYGVYATTLSSGIIGGGVDNYLTQNYGTIGGGLANQVTSESAFRLNDFGTVSGGRDNVVNGDAGTIPGGAYNVATNYAFAAGRSAKARHTGAFVWADSTGRSLSQVSPMSLPSERVVESCSRQAEAG